tara:strand:- start:1356 stop:2090 length:735 start_codon:yes stop_codon:yes gene_type:complete
MLQKNYFFVGLLNLIFMTSSYSKPVLEFLGTKTSISAEKSIGLVKPVKIDPIVATKTELKEFLKRYGVLKLHLFSGRKNCDDQETSFSEEQIEEATVKKPSDDLGEFKPVEPVNTSLLSGIEIPDSFGPELIILEDSHLGEYIKFGLWSNNLRTWNIFKLNLHTYKTDSLSTDVYIDKDQAKAEVRYNYRIGTKDTIELKFYNQVNHDVLTPTKLQSGGQIQYKFKVGRFNFGVYFFGSHELDL